MKGNSKFVKSACFPQGSSKARLEVHHLLKTDLVASLKPDDFEFRDLTLDDTGKMLLLHKECFPIPYPEEYFVRNIEMDYKEAIGMFITINDEKHLVGCILCEVNSINEFNLTFPNPYDFGVSVFNKIAQYFHNGFIRLGYIQTICVVEELRGKDIGRLLLNKMEEKLVRTYYFMYGFYLHVVEFNKPALKFYEKNGFTNVSVLKNHYKMKGELHDGFVLCKAFK